MSTTHKTNSEADRQLAVIQQDTLLRFNRRTWAVPVGMTIAVARYKARKEILNAAVMTHIRVKHRRYVRLNAMMVKEGKLPMHTHRELNRAALKWKRAAYHRIRQVKAFAIARRQKQMQKLYRPPSLKAIY